MESTKTQFERGKFTSLPHLASMADRDRHAYNHERCYNKICVCSRCDRQLAGTIDGYPRICSDCFMQCNMCSKYFELSYMRLNIDLNDYERTPKFESLFFYELNTPDRPVVNLCNCCYELYLEPNEIPTIKQPEEE